MAMEIEVKQTVGHWGCHGRTFTPGIYIVDDEVIIEAARNTQHCIVRDAPDGAETGVVTRYDNAPAKLVNEDGSVKPLSGADLAHGNDAPLLDCPVGCGADGFVNQASLDEHTGFAHPTYVPPPEPIEPEPVDDNPFAPTPRTEEDSSGGVEASNAALAENG